MLFLFRACRFPLYVLIFQAVIKILAHFILLCAEGGKGPFAKKEPALQPFDNQSNAKNIVKLLNRMSMHSTTLRLLFLSAVVALVLPSCVSKKKFDQLMEEKGALAESLAQSQEQVKNLEERVAALESELESEKARLNGEIEGLKGQLSSAQADLAAAQKAAAEKDAELARIKKEIKEAFSIPGDLNVENRDGQLYAVLANPVQYRSGSTRINKEGREALKQLAETLKNNPNLHVLIEGHTDNVPVKEGAAYRDNWDLSVARAMGVVRTLIKEGVNPEQVAVAGRGEFQPKADNSTEEGKAQNRRTEVKPSPATGKIFQLGGN